MEQFKAYSDPKRDPRFHTLSVVFLAQTKGSPKAQDDAKALGFYSLHSLPTLCFDHGQILGDYIEAKSRGLLKTFQERQVTRLSEMPNSAREYLISLAKQAISHSLRHGTSKKQPVAIDLPDEALLYVQPYGVFVTLEVDGMLRGCIGSLENSSKPLYELVWSMAIQAAFFDPRFQPLDDNELPKLTVEISVLTPLASVKDMTSIEIGKHGLILERGPQRGLLLPQVATELHLDPVGFLEAVSTKAGLKKDAWKAFETKVATFEAYILKEEQNP
jgi:AmmeMemoRadiSam system protein A